MKPTVWIFSIEPIESRYTCQWHIHLPQLFEQQLGDQFTIRQIDGVQQQSQATAGAFLNFADTNLWKSSQLSAFLQMYNQGLVSPNDHLVFTDAWNPTVLQIKYMRDLLQLNWTVHGLWHAGSWDSHDFLGRLVGNELWVKNCELAMYHAVDHNYFATQFHAHMFWNNLIVQYGHIEDRLSSAIDRKKIVRTGWPFEFLPQILRAHQQVPKRDLILFPHRVAPEKQVEIFKDLATHLPQYQWVVCQEQQLTKSQYHQLLAESKMVFSANLQETLGISTCAEGPISRSVPMAPSRLSYTEIFSDYPEFLYPSEWTESWDQYQLHRTALIDRVLHTMNNYEQLTHRLHTYNSTVFEKYFHADQLISKLKVG
jgi:hypothetical protein